MKRIVPVPPLSADTPLPWRSEAERVNDPAFQSRVLREFPDGADELELDENGRREFLKVMGASMALAGVGFTGCRRPEKHLVPYTKTPEFLVPGRPMLYATSMPRRNGAWPLLVSTFDGRPVKIEGNPTHPASNGSTDLFAQGSVLDLYDPRRSRAFKRAGEVSDAAAFDAWLAQARTEWSGNGGKSVAFLVERDLSPTRERLRRKIREQFPAALWCEYEPLGDDAARAAQVAAFGAPGHLDPQWDKAKVILSLGNDFLGNEATLTSVPGFSRARRVRESAKGMNRLYVAENRFTVTGGMADHRLRVPFAHLPALAVAIAEKLGGAAASLAAKVDAGKRAAAGGNLPDEWVKAVAEDLLAHKGAALVVASGFLPAPVHALVLAINETLGAFDGLIRTVASPVEAGVEIAAVAKAAEAGELQTMFILGGNPAYNAPAGVKWAEVQAKVPAVVRLSLLEDETSAAGSMWQVPAAHYLEAWGDAVSVDGTYCCIQPMILPLFGGWSEIDLLARVAGIAKPEGPELVQETFTAVTGSSTPHAWSTFVHDGYAKDSAKPGAARPNLGALDALIGAFPSAPKVAADSLELVLTPAPTLDDGRFANNAWLQEVPDPVTKLTWDNVLLMSPATAKALGVKDRDYAMADKHSDVVRVAVDGCEVEVAALIAPGHADHSVSLALGYGRALAGHVCEDAGSNAYPFRVQPGDFVRAGARVEKTAKRRLLAITQEHQVMENRFTFRQGTAELFEHNRDFPHKLDPLPLEEGSQSLYPNPPLNDQHQWAMVIDLNACTGCNACVVACQAENNIPVVGKEQVLRSREMHWIRSDVYYLGDVNDPMLGTQPVPCMHCENAPCETVCPVNATVHSEDGLNVMAYNRCIGTRYCANNCPYKVRRFNYFDYNQRPVFQKNNSIVGRLFKTTETGQDGLYMGPFAPKGTAETLKLQKNPNVTVRMRGVIEKCTFCVQRIESAKIEQLKKAKASPDTMVPADSFKTACQQACPAEAIVFGNKSDTNSQVSTLRGMPQVYGLLEYLLVKPRVTFMARLRNPNMAVPGAKDLYHHPEIGGELIDAHGHDHHKLSDHGKGHGDSHGGGHQEAEWEKVDPHGTEGQRGGL
jgi:molybdopterin-containing oxidoreductase family iron-sulfur binding subunit